MIKNKRKTSSLLSECSLSKTQKSFIKAMSGIEGNNNNNSMTRKKKPQKGK